MPHGNPYSCQKLASIEWFGQIVVGSGIKCIDLVLLLFTCGYDYNGGMCPFAQPLCYLQTVEIGQSKIKQNHVGTTRCCLHETLLCSCRLHQTVAVCLECNPQKASHLRFIFNQQYKLFF